MPNHGLPPAQLKTLLDVLAPYAAQIERVSLFGSRATGTYRPNSDIDMVLYGDIEETQIDRIWTLFDSSALPVKVDVVGYRFIASSPLKLHIDQAEKTLFVKNDLLAHRLTLVSVK